MSENFVRKGEGNPGKLTDSKTVGYDQIEQWNNRGYHIERLGDSFSALIVGEAHEVADFEEKQAELIGIIKPEYVLHEHLCGWIYNPNTKEFTKQEGRVFDNLDQVGIAADVPRRIIDAADETGCKIIGCDLTYAELQAAYDEIGRKNPDKWHYDAARGHYMRTKTDRDSQKLYDELRETKMVEIIAGYQKESNRPIIVILGGQHGENLQKKGVFQKMGFGYVFIDQPGSESRKKKKRKRK